MEFSILIKKAIRKRLALWIISFGLVTHTNAQSFNFHTDKTLKHFQYISAFTRQPELTKPSPIIFTDTISEKSRYYTIQICTLDHFVTDAFFQGNYQIKCIKMGDLYRYVFSNYYTLEEARKKLTSVQKIFPEACIREYRQGILGLMIDMNIEHKN